jgi:hypothetical protein
VIRTCETCQYFLPDDTRTDAVGICRRFPPQVYADEDANEVRATFPTVAKESWCGEFKAPSVAAEAEIRSFPKRRP